MKLVNKHKNTYYYKAVEDYYKGKVAKRSKLPYMNHINEGIVILETFHAPHMAIEAFCLHPLFQGDDALKENYNNKELHSLMGTGVMQLVMEYRNLANDFLASAKMIEGKEPKLSPILNVNWMLLADKIQNYKDFLKHQRHSYMGDEAIAAGLKATMGLQKWMNLNQYFKDWLEILLPYFGLKEIDIKKFNLL